MSKKMDIVAVIHARGGSRRIPLKNLALLAGKPLIAYPILLAKASRFVTRLIVSTDHDGIMAEAKRLGAEAPFRRPADISEDVPSEKVSAHALEALEKEGYKPEIMITLTPATPFTTPTELDSGIQLLLDHPDWDSVVTVRRAAEHPEWMLRQDKKSETFKTVLGNPLDGEYNVSQNLQPAYYPCGAFYINRVASFRAQPSLYGKRFGAVVLDAQRAIDIDTPEDLIRANALANSKEGSRC